jgi:preprotein translocase subunit SecB
MMEPVDFAALYMQNLRNMQAQKQAGAGAPAAPAGESKPN